MGEREKTDGGSERDFGSDGQSTREHFLHRVEVHSGTPPPYSRPLHPHPHPLSHTPLTPVDVEHTLRVGHVGTARGRRDCTEAAALGEIRFGAREDLGGGGGVGRGRGVPLEGCVLEGGRGVSNWDEWKER